MAESYKPNFKDYLPEDEVLAQFEKLRQKQRRLYAKLASTEESYKEHRQVANILNETNSNTTCLRYSNGVLTERKVKDVYPMLLKDKEQLENTLENIKGEIKSASAEIIEFQKTYNIKVRAEPSARIGSSPL